MALKKRVSPKAICGLSDQNHKYVSPLIPKINVMYEK